MISLQVSLDEDEDDLMRAGEGEQRGGRVRQRCRHRHFSLEDYQGHESEDSNLSSLSMGLSSCDNSGTAGATEVEEDANHSVLMSFRKNGEWVGSLGDASGWYEHPLDLGLGVAAWPLPWLTYSYCSDRMAEYPKSNSTGGFAVQNGHLVS